MIVESILGERREPSRIFEDGSYTCPFCGAAVLAEWEPLVTREGFGARCRNPVCSAGPTTRAAAEERRAEQIRYREERERRERDHAAWEARMAASREARVREVEGWRRLAADEEGYCFRCLYATDGRRRVRHRSPGYHEGGR